MPSDKSNVPIEMALEGDPGFPRKGKIDFINNQVNPSTGTVAVRAIFDNERPEGGLWKLSGGMFVRGLDHPQAFDGEHFVHAA